MSSYNEAADGSEAENEIRKETIWISWKLKHNQWITLRKELE